MLYCALYTGLTGQLVQRSGAIKCMDDEGHSIADVVRLPVKKKKKKNGER